MHLSRPKSSQALFPRIVGPHHTRGPPGCAGRNHIHDGNPLCNICCCSSHRHSKMLRAHDTDLFLGSLHNHRWYLGILVSS